MWTVRGKWCVTGETGFLVPPQTVAPLAAALVELVENETLRGTLGGRGRELFTEQFRHQNMTAQLRQLYEQIRSTTAK